MKHVSLGQDRDRLSALVNDAAHGGQRIVLSSRGRPKAVLIGMDDLERLERAGVEAPTIGREMLGWIEQVEETQRGQRPVKRSSSEALREVREDADAGTIGLPRRKPRAQ